MTPRLTRLLYRSFLRACDNGRWPECLPPEGLRRPLPSQPSEVVAQLRSHFEGPRGQSEVEPFAALRHARSTADALWPAVSAAAERPAFVFRSPVLLPHEAASFVFFEPRYRRLAELALAKDQRFVQLPVRKEELRDPSAGPPVGTLCTITEHHHLNDGRIAVRCLAGPRVVVKSQRDEPVPECTEAPPLLHVSCKYAEDEPSADADADAALAQQCIDMLDQLSPVAGMDLFLTATVLPPEPPLYPARTGLTPPLFETERLSFFLAVVLSRCQGLDMRDRLSMLYGRCTTDRLEHTAELLHTMLLRRGVRPKEKPQLGNLRS